MLHNCVTITFARDVDLAIEKIAGLVGLETLIALYLLDNRLILHLLIREHFISLI